MNRLVDVCPDKGFYRAGDTVLLSAAVSGTGAFTVECQISHLATKVAAITAPILVTGDEGTVGFEWLPPPVAPRGYGVDVQLIDRLGHTVDSYSTAFDVLPDWTAYPRYGFLSDFAPHRSDMAATLDELVRFHINGLQFYDWQYRHDDPIAPSIEFDDPLGRRLSLETIQGLADEARKRGMATMAYVAVYAASAAFWRANPQWALYDDSGKPLKFGEDFLGLMNPTRGTQWANHLQQRCDEILADLPFDGIHIDQYGEPRTAFDASGNLVELPAAFVEFVTEFKERHPESPTTFNAVKNWPIEALVSAPTDFVYIELWPDTPTYRAIGEIVNAAHTESGGKPVVIALYLPKDRPINIRLADAVIIANGGSRIELGEQGRLLSDPYFPLHEALSPGLRDVLRRYSDFRVRYGDLLGPTSTPSRSRIRSADDLWAVARDVPGWITINLVNMSGIGEARWDEAHSMPQQLTDVSIDIDTETAVRQVWWASPDRNDCHLKPTKWSTEDGNIHVTVPAIDYWTIVVIELDSEKEAS
ncbi:MAG: glycoside hydrolase family 66 protein [Actinomycetia bacterium]|nr:glycoside hydrolase family 66 protein [Actinomycetes bacterium]